MTTSFMVSTIAFEWCMAAWWSQRTKYSTSREHHSHVIFTIKCWVWNQQNTLNKIVCFSVQIRSSVGWSMWRCWFTTVLLCNNQKRFWLPTWRVFHRYSDERHTTINRSSVVADQDFSYCGKKNFFWLSMVFSQNAYFLTAFLRFSLLQSVAVEELCLVERNFQQLLHFRALPLLAWP